MKRFLLSLGVLLLAGLTGCATNSMTGRAQLSLVSESTVSSKSSMYYQSMLGDLQKKNKVVSGDELNTRIDSITNRLIQQAVLFRPKSAEWGWKVSVIDDEKTINAFCMPGGLMAIYTGLIHKLDATDDEIAQVMGHEIGHALASHGAEKMSMQVTANLAVVVASAAASSNNREFQNNQNVLTLAALAFVNLPNSRTAESEADRIGIELAARAGYDPAAAVTLWTKMTAATDGKGGSDFFRTHPAPEKRLENLRALAEPMAPLYAKAKSDGAKPVDWLHGDFADKPTIDESQAQAFYSESWDRFQKGLTELAGNNVPGFVLKQSSMSEHYAKSRWRDLATQVIDADFNLDLSYFYLAEAATGLGFKDASTKYMKQALDMSQSDETSCAKRMFLTCSGINLTAAGIQ